MSDESGSPEPKRRAAPVSEWSKARTRLIGQQVRRYRAERGWDIKALVEETERLGHGLPRVTISALESGRREGVSVAEWLVLSNALRVNPVALLLPLGTEETVEIMPGLTWPTDRALAWVDGWVDPWPHAEDGPAGATPAALAVRRHGELVRTLVARVLQHAAGDLISGEDGVREAERSLREHRREMTARGEVPPALPEQLAGLDEGLTIGSQP